MSLSLLFLSSALAAEVVWVTPADDATRVRVAEQAGASRTLTPLDLRAGATDVSDDDAEAIRALAATLEDVRTYETQLDGELIIMRDLQQAVERVGLLRDASDRSALYAALAYQGFAANRFFGDELAEAEEAEPYRLSLESRTMERPWVDAVALEPEREVTAYEIAEAPQRVTFEARRETLAELLPASLEVADLPEGATLFVDGRPTTPGPAGSVKVRPGRHLAHVALDDHVLARWDVRVGAADSAPLAVSLTDEMWDGFLATVQPDGALPEAVTDAVEALGGEVWLAWSGDGDAEPRVLALTPSGVASVEIAPPSTTEVPEGPDPMFEVSAALVGGWLTSGDFYVQDPQVAPRSVATVNSAAVGVSAAAWLAPGLLRVGAGVDVLVPTGQHAVALTGDTSLRARPTPFVAVGLPWVQGTAGWLFPYHPAVGGRAALPLAGPVELRMLGWYGLPTRRTRADGTTWEGLAVGTVAGGIGVRL